MPLTYEDTKDGGILVKGKGVISANEIKEINNDLYRSPENILKIKYQLWDLTEVSDALVSNADITFFANQDNAAVEVNPNMIIAIVANSDLIFGLSRMWDVYSNFKHMVYRDIADAEKWIDEMIGNT